MKSLMIVTENLLIRNSFFMIARQLGLSVRFVQLHEVCARVSQEKPDIVLVSCDEDTDTRIIQTLKSLNLNIKISGFGFARRPVHLQDYLRLPFLVENIATFAKAFGVKGKKGNK